MCYSAACSLLTPVPPLVYQCFPRTILPPPPPASLTFALSCLSASCTPVRPSTRLLCNSVVVRLTVGPPVNHHRTALLLGKMESRARLYIAFVYSYGAVLIQSIGGGGGGGVGSQLAKDHPNFNLGQ